MFRAMNDVDFPVADVLRGSRFTTLTWSQRRRSTWWIKPELSTTTSSTASFSQRKRRQCLLEFMDVRLDNAGWMTIVPNRDIVTAIPPTRHKWQLTRQYEVKLAERWRYTDGSGESTSFPA